MVKNEYRKFRGKGRFVKTNVMKLHLYKKDGKLYFLGRKFIRSRKTREQEARWKAEIKANIKAGNAQLRAIKKQARIDARTQAILAERRARAAARRGG